MKYNREQRIEQIKDNFWAGVERPYVDEYLKALESKEPHNNAYIFEQFSEQGAGVHQIIRNYRAVLVREKFGFTDYSLNEYGWMEQPKWLDVEEIDFSVGKENYSGNQVRIGRGPNGKYAIGYSYGGGKGCGGGGSINEYGEAYDNRDDAVIASLEILLKFHKEAIVKSENDTTNYNKKYSKAMVLILEDYKKEIINPMPVQLELF